MKTWITSWTVMINEVSEVFHFVFICSKCHGIPHEVWNLYHSVAQHFKVTSLKLVTTNQLTAVDAVTVFVVKKNRNSGIKKHYYYSSNHMKILKPARSFLATVKHGILKYSITRKQKKKVYCTSCILFCFQFCLH